MERIKQQGSLAMADKENKPMESDGKYVGEAVGNFSKEEWYPGGALGTTDNVASGCYEDESPAVTAQGLIDDFNAGEKFFERQFTSANSGFKGLGPVSCSAGPSVCTAAPLLFALSKSLMLNPAIS